MSRPISPELVLSPDFWISNIPRYFSFAFHTARNTTVPDKRKPKVRKKYPAKLQKKNHQTQNTKNKEIKYKKSIEKFINIENRNRFHSIASDVGKDMYTSSYYQLNMSQFLSRSWSKNVFLFENRWWVQ